MSSKVRLYVGNLSRDCRAVDMERLFDRYGRVKDIHITQAGYGFVEYYDPRDADDALTSCDGRDFLGQRIKVQRSKDRRSDGSLSSYDARRQDRGGDRDRERGRGWDDRDKDRYRRDDRDRGGYDDRRRYDSDRSKRVAAQHNRCFVCDKEGHFARDCPNGDSRRSDRRDRSPSRSRSPRRERSPSPAPRRRSPSRSPPRGGGRSRSRSPVERRYDEGTSSSGRAEGAASPTAGTNGFSNP